MMYVKIRTMTHKRDERRVFLPDFCPIHAVHIRVVEEVAHLPPGSVVDLFPLRSLVHIDLQVRQVQLVAELGLGGWQNRL